MAVSIKHKFVNPTPDAGNPNEVGPDEWNDEHDIAGLDKAAVGLDQVENTSDADKPVSDATQTALDAKANTADLATVATSGDYNDLINTPSIPTGDMTKAVYDPNSVEDDAFDQDNMVDGTTNKNFTATEKTKLAGIEALADVTDAANVAAAGAFMKTSDDSDDITEGASKLLMTTSERSKLSGIEALADVTDAVNIASSIHGVSGKTTPVDADELALIDSAASNVLKKLTWANVKATLKTYFDTLYAPVGAIASSLLTTRGDIITRDASGPIRRALGAAKTVLRSDGTDALFAQLAHSDLSDYVEGTFTPALNFGGGATGLTYSNQVGKYTRVGRVVTASFDLRLSAKGSSTGTAQLTGLPLTAGAGINGGGALSEFFNMASLTSYVAVAVQASTTNAVFNSGGTTGTSNLTNAHFTNSSIIAGTVVYQL